MTDQAFDFWYAVNNTEILKLPEKRLETFGASTVTYHLLSEMMDSVERVRVREGRIEAYRPEIITRQHFDATTLEGFGEAAGAYAQWLRKNQDNLMLLKYGFAIRKQEVNDHIVSERLPTVIEQVRDGLEEKQDPAAALVVGVDQPWEVCLIKLMVEVVQQSAPTHVQELRRDPHGHRHEIEAAFLEASRDPSHINELNSLLQRYGMFAEYEDRFFALVRSSG